MSKERLCCARLKGTITGEGDALVNTNQTRAAPRVELVARGEVSPRSRLEHRVADTAKQANGARVSARTNGAPGGEETVVFGSDSEARAQGETKERVREREKESECVSFNGGRSVIRR